jgi:hypothetical protein
MGRQLKFNWGLEEYQGEEGVRVTERKLEVWR